MGNQSILWQEDPAKASAVLGAGDSWGSFQIQRKRISIAQLHWTTFKSVPKLDPWPWQQMRLSQLAASLPTEKHSEVSHPDTTHREPKHWNYSNESVYSVNSKTKCNCLGVAKPQWYSRNHFHSLKKAELRASPWGTPSSSRPEKPSMKMKLALAKCSIIRPISWEEH